MLPQGFKLDDYRIIEVLGAGGFGITYLAEDETLNVKVAIKEFMPTHLARHDGTTVNLITRSQAADYDRLLETFITESRNVARIQHPNIMRVRRCFKTNGTAYMVMDYEQGVDLEEHLRTLERRPNEEELRRITVPLLEGMETVHENGLIHRDIKPSNIFIRRADGSPVLLDFGSARRADSTHFTQVLTAGYAPYEQYEDSGQGPWTDIYGMAAVLYRAVTGIKPQAALNRMVNDRLTPASIACQDGGYSRNLLAGIDWGLSIAAHERPQSVEQWRNVLVHGRTVAEVATSRTALAEADDLDGTLSEVNAAARRKTVSEDEAWADAAAANTPATYRTYLDLYPTGSHATRAREALSMLAEKHRRQHAEDLKRNEDEQDWARAFSENKIESFRAYLLHRPTGKHAAAARAAVVALEEGEWRQRAAEYERRQATTTTTTTTKSDQSHADKVNDNDLDSTCELQPTETTKTAMTGSRPQASPPHETQTDDPPGQWEIQRPPLLMASVMALLSVVVAITTNMILKMVMHGLSLSSMGLSLLITWALGFAYAHLSREVNPGTATATSLATALIGTLSFFFLLMKIGH
ncbi:membrane hypothetical protein [uncultured Gammaproteobacteria bacterium]